MAEKITDDGKGIQRHGSWERAMIFPRHGGNEELEAPSHFAGNSSKQSGVGNKCTHVLFESFDRISLEGSEL